MSLLRVLQRARPPRALEARFGATIPVSALASAGEPLPPPLAGGEEARLRTTGSRADERPKAMPEGRAGWGGGRGRP